MHFTTLPLLFLGSTLAAAAESGFSGTIETKDGGLGGTITVVNDTALSISHYTLKDASAPALYWWGSKTSDLPKGFRINNERVDKPASTDMVTIMLDAGHKASDFEYVGLWCEKLNANFGQAKLSKDGGDDKGSSTMMSSGSGAAASPTGKGGDKTGAAAGLDTGKMALAAVANAVAFAAFLA